MAQKYNCFSVSSMVKYATSIKVDTARRGDDSAKEVDGEGTVQEASPRPENVAALWSSTRNLRIGTAHQGSKRRPITGSCGSAWNVAAKHLERTAGAASNSASPASSAHGQARKRMILQRRHRAKQMSQARTATSKYSTIGVTTPRGPFNHPQRELKVTSGGLALGQKMVNADCLTMDPGLRSEHPNRGTEGGAKATLSVAKSMLSEPNQLSHRQRQNEEATHSGGLPPSGYRFQIGVPPMPSGESLPEDPLRAQQ